MALEKERRRPLNHTYFSTLGEFVDESGGQHIRQEFTDGIACENFERKYCERGTAIGYAWVRRCTRYFGRCLPSLRNQTNRRNSRNEKDCCRSGADQSSRNKFSWRCDSRGRPIQFLQNRFSR